MKKLYELQQVTAYFQTGISRILVVDVIGLVPTSGWHGGRLVSWSVMQKPTDGIYDMDILGTPPTGACEEVIVQLRVVTAYPNPPPDLRGVRIHAAHNRMEALIVDARSLRHRIPPQNVAEAGEYPWV